MKTITLTDNQFDTLFEFVDQKVEYIVDKSVEYQDSEMLDDWDDLIDVHTLLENVKVKYETKLQIAQSKQPDMEWQDTYISVTHFIDFTLLSPIIRT